MTIRYKNVEVVLSQEETEAIKYLTETNCNGVKCSYCPFNLDDTAGRCLRTLANEVFMKIKYDPVSRQAYRIYNEE